ncbi:extensin family protein [Paraliomyxa miuraensis]|uniref:extensin family protein n=1 Tax=Paraliomyxa miuraensis TaxID=376150 RepID=UPI00225706DC|nr:extensin family protein [Paraliomyxa miuraensis]MCX4246505.1 extensin family protein [Paraliomyxa miuraensis]
MRLVPPPLRLVLVLLPTLLVGSGGDPPRLPNMPRGWTWPPSETMRAASEHCKATLEQFGVAYEAVPEEVLKISTPIVLPRLEVGALRLHPLRGPGRYPMDCALALAFHQVEPALREQGVRSLRFRAMHDYRNVRKRGRTTSMLSRHAIGLAVDVFEVEFDDGTIAVVKRDFAREPRLKAMVDVFAASAAFRDPLSPANDPKDHDDHVHLEARLPLERPPSG